MYETKFSIVTVIKSKYHMKINMEQKVRMVVSKYDSKNREVVWHRYTHHISAQSWSFKNNTQLFCFQCMCVIFSNGTKLL